MPKYTDLDARVAQTDYAVERAGDYNERFAEYDLPEAMQQARDSGLLWEIENTYPAYISQSEYNRLSQPFNGYKDALMRELQEEMEDTYDETDDVADIRRLDHDYAKAQADFSALFNDVLSLEAKYVASKKENATYTNSVVSTMTLGFIDRAKPNPQRLAQIAAIVQEAKDINDSTEDSEYYEECISSLQGAKYNLETALLALRSEIKDGEYGSSWLANPTNSKLFSLLEKAAEGKSDEQIKHRVEAYQLSKEEGVTNVRTAADGMSFSV